MNKKTRLQVNVRFTEEEFKELNYVRYHLGFTTLSEVIRYLVEIKSSEIKERIKK